MAKQTKRGRPEVADNLKKKNYTITLDPEDAKALRGHYGTLTEAIRASIVNTKPQLLDELKKLQTIINKLVNLKSK